MKSHFDPVAFSTRLDEHIRDLSRSVQYFYGSTERVRPSGPTRSEIHIAREPLCDRRRRLDVQRDDLGGRGEEEGCEAHR